MDDEKRDENQLPNFETWAAWLWLTSNDGPYRDWRETIGHEREEGRKLWASGHVTAWMEAHGCRTEAETTRRLLAEKIRAALAAYMTMEWPEFCPPKLRAALLEVDCGEIAGAMLAEEIPTPPPRAKFDLGLLVLTPGSATELRPLDIFVALLRYARSDWGELGHREREENERSLKEGAGLRPSTGRRTRGNSTSSRNSNAR